MSSFCAVATTCFKLAHGFTMQAEVPKILPTVVLASYQPVKGCDGNIEGMEFGSACRFVPKPKEKFRLSWGPPSREVEDKYFPKIQALPRIVIREPRTAIKHVQNKKSGSGRIASKGAPAEAAVATPSIVTQVADQVVRKGILYGAQAGGFAVGGPLGAWGGCTGVTFGYMVKEGLEAKERWTLFDTAGNGFLAGITCSPVGFILRFVLAKTPQERAFALAGALTLIGNPYIDAGLQLSPAITALIPQGKATERAWLWTPTEPYHKGEWEAR